MPLTRLLGATRLLLHKQEDAAPSRMHEKMAREAWQADALCVRAAAMRLDAGDDARGDLRLRPLRGLCLRLTLRLAADAAAWRYAPTHSTSRRMPRHHECMRKWRGEHDWQTGIALRGCLALRAYTLHK